ncbi:MAG: protein kinase [Polyangiaceae bacterium]|nr:protein kinase [Polyangiaceae bacterium]
MSGPSLAKAQNISPYVPLANLAAGGMAEVTLCVKRDGRFERLYALKRPLPQFRLDPGFREMFLDEARVAGVVHHANAVGVVDFGEDQDGLFLAMDFVEGVSVAHLLSAVMPKTSLLPVQACVTIASQAARGLHAAHEAKTADGHPLHIVHRDVSPRNILVGYDGVVRVADFGIAKALGNAFRTSTGILKGSLGYMSPELLKFQTPDRRSDLFSLGIVLFELLTRERLYTHTESAIAPHRILNEAPPDAGEFREDLPPELVELLFEMLAKNPDDRPPTAEQVAQRLESILHLLAAEEGAFDLSSFLAEQFGEEREKLRSDIQRQLASLREAPNQSREEARPEQLDAVSQVSLHRRSWAKPFIGIVALSLVGVVAWGEMGDKGKPIEGATQRAMAPASKPRNPEARGVQNVWAGAWHSCATRQEQLFCWGKNGDGQLGEGTYGDRGEPYPVPLHDVSMASGGNFHTCAVKQGGQLYCWGRNTEGQLGLDPAKVPSAPQPTPLPTMTDVIAFDAGDFASCAVRRDGSVWCWGKLLPEGQPPPPAFSPRGAPRRMPGLDDAIAVSVSESHACALLRAGTVLCWGSNTHGELGSTQQNFSPTPLAVPGVSGVIQVGTGAGFTCTLSSRNRVSCWGDNSTGQLGIGAATRVAREPRTIEHLDGVSQISVSDAWACARHASDQVKCWGNGTWGNLGNGGLDMQYTPVRVQQLEDAIWLTTGSQHACVRRKTGALACWGLNSSGQLGDASGESRTIPVSPTTPPPL